MEITLDTHAFIWYLDKSLNNKLSPKALKAIKEAARDARYEGREFDKDYLITRILEKYNKVRDCAVSIIRQKGINNVVHADIKPFLERLNK